MYRFVKEIRDSNMLNSVTPPEREQQNKFMITRKVLYYAVKLNYDYCLIGIKLLIIPSPEIIDYNYELIPNDEYTREFLEELDLLEKMENVKI